MEILIASDLHYAGPAERARPHFESTLILNPVLRALVRLYRKYIWMAEPLDHYDMVKKLIAEAGQPDFTVLIGDYSCDSAFVGISDDAVFASVQDCLERLRVVYEPHLAITIGDHELGKFSVFGGHGGMRLASYHRATNDLKLAPFWQKDFGVYVLIGVTSTLGALPVFDLEMLQAERKEWEQLRAAHLSEINAAFGRLRPEQWVLLFCHDPTALPFLAELPEVHSRLGQIEATVIGHLHSELVIRTARILSGMPRIAFLGSTVRRLSSALAMASQWRSFRVRLCPSLAGIEMLRDGGYLTATIDPTGQKRSRFKFHPLAWD